MRNFIIGRKTSTALITTPLFIALSVAVSGCAASSTSGASPAASQVLSSSLLPSNPVAAKQSVMSAVSAAKASISAAARTQSAGKATVTPPQPQPLPTVRTNGGLNTEVHSGPMHTTEMTVTDSWQGQVGTQWLMVFAGTVPASGLGSVALYTLPLDPTSGDTPSLVGYFTRAGTTELKLSAVNASTADAELIDGSGTALAFDLKTHTFR